MYLSKLEKIINFKTYQVKACTKIAVPVISTLIII